jgi:hypothetical protein
MSTRRIIILSLLIFGLISVLWSIPKAKRFVEIDRCLDRGGSWNYVKQECEYGDTNDTWDNKENNIQIDTNKLFNVWSIDPNGPHADFWITQNEFYIADFDGNGSMRYNLWGDSIEVFYPDNLMKGRITFVSNDTLKIIWDNFPTPIVYSAWKK